LWSLPLLGKDYNAAHALISPMGSIGYQKEAMGLYITSDPNGYWTVIIPFGENHAQL
jgi:hypothetical protein